MSYSRTVDGKKQVIVPEGYNNNSNWLAAMQKAIKTNNGRQAWGRDYWYK